MKTALSILAVVIFLLTGVFVLFFEGSYKTGIVVQLNNTFAEKIEIRGVFVDSGAIDGAAPLFVEPGTESSRSNVALNLGMHWNPRRLVILGQPSAGDLISCELKGVESGELCVLRIDLASHPKNVCHCDSSSDFDR